MSIYKRFIFTLVTGIMFIGLLTFYTGQPLKSAMIVDTSAKEDVPSPTVTPSPEPVVETGTPVPTQEAETTPVPTQDEDAPNPLLEEIYPDIHDLIEQYLNAKANADIDTLKTLVVDPLYISVETITAQSEFIKGYSDIKCYTKRGGGDIKFVVYCTFNMLVTTIDTPIASLESFYITYKDGKPLVFSGLFDEETQKMLDKLDNDEDVIALKEYTSEQIAKALKEDPALYEFWKKLINFVGDDQLPSEESTDEPEITN
ncbi:MAG: hypothetical protein IKP88_10725 [Lachnospiraceae bacterium]|nr:hypothetical protein [Lachnospiraceae bacterium]